MNNYEEMKIEGDVFATARENFDLLMQRLFASMEKNKRYKSRYFGDMKILHSMIFYMT